VRFALFWRTFVVPEVGCNILDILMSTLLSTLLLSTLLAASGLATPPLTADSRRQLVVAALKRFDQLAAMASRGDPEGCSTALEELAALDEAGVTFELGPNAHNRAMRVCSAELESVERLFAELATEGRQDAASLEALASIRLENDLLAEAAEAVAELLAPALEVKTTKLGRELPRKQLPERTARIARSVLEACAEAELPDEQLGGAPQLWHELGELGLWAPPPPPPVLERTFALLKPDCLRAEAEAEVEALIAAHGFATVARRRWRMDEAEAATFLSTSWGSAAGDRARRFFAEMSRFYCSGEVRAGCTAPALGQSTLPVLHGLHPCHHPPFGTARYSRCCSSARARSPRGASSSGRAIPRWRAATRTASAASTAPRRPRACAPSTGPTSRRTPRTARTRPRRRGARSA
jgi:hypothetical protein